VLVAGAGPTGMMLAAELALAGVDVTIVERRPTADLLGSRARGLHSRSIEVLDQRGVAERFLSQGYTVPVVGFAGAQLDVGDFPSRHNYTLALRQDRFEQILAQWIDELAIPVRRALAVVGLTQDGSGVDVELSDGSTVRAHYVVGCDGGRSVVRRAAGIEFPGSDATISNIIAEVELAHEPPVWGIHRDAIGIHALSKSENGGAVGVLITERYLSTTEPTLDDLKKGLVAVYGTDFGVHSPTWISRFTNATRQAAKYRDGRVFLAGDAAHIHPPDGGQGLDTGLQDAVNLGWKLAQVIEKTSPESLLDTYHMERQPVGARVIRHALASIPLRSDDARARALREMIAEIVAMDEPRKHVAGMLSALDVRYDFGEGHPLLGRRMPDLDVLTGDGMLRVFTLLNEARWVLLNLGSAHALDIGLWANRVKPIDARYDGIWELPVVGVVAPPNAVLIRPDGYVAWVGDGSDRGLASTLTAWVGTPAPQAMLRRETRYGKSYRRSRTCRDRRAIAGGALHEAKKMPNR
jgi:2-polyprenyl-6-methoxyphenol hydroxylase-like FAD-dependent oxidoreductase